MINLFPLTVEQVENERATPREHRSRYSTVLHLVDRMHMVSPVRQISYMEEMDKMGAYAWLRIRPKAPNTVKMWYEDAKCYEMDSELFEPALEGGSRQENLTVSGERMEQAKQACDDCPVWHLCYQKAQENDFFYTMRAGLRPGQLVEYEELGRVNYRSGQEQERCVNGHNDWVIWGKARPRKKCRECARLDGERKRGMLKS